MSIGVPGGGAGICAGTSGCQLDGCTKREPMAMKAMTTVSLMATMMLLTVADSETPTTSRAVTQPTMKTAGRLTIPVAMTTPAALVTGTPQAAVSAAGIWIPRLSPSRLTV